MTFTVEHKENLVALVVDDDFSLRLLMRESLEQGGFVVEEAEDGQQGLALFARVRPDIVLLDVMMPEMDGFATCAALRQLPGGERTPVLMTTGLDDIDSINRAYEAGATDFITKPITWPILSHRVRYLLRAGRAIEELHVSQEALRKAHDEMETRVEERTAALSQANALLQQEIRERRQAEEELRLRDHAIASTSEGICITDPHQPDNPLIYVNVGFERLSGYRREEILGRNCRFLQGSETDRATIETLRAVVREERECVVEVLNYRKDGAPFWNRLSITPVRNLAGKVTHYIGVQSDITDRKEVERLKDELVSTVSHELRTPLTSLRGFAELMLKRNFSYEKQRHFLTIIHKESLRLTNLINDFLDLQRIESGRQVYTFDSVDLVAILREQVEVFSREDAVHHFRCEAPAWLPTVSADADRVRQVLANLLSNAIKFSPDGGDIVVATRHEGNEIVIRVIDHGLGIPTDVQSQLFSKFFRVENHETRSIGGTGLGLALVKEIIVAHGGRVWVESVHGQGSTFSFTLPVGHGARVTPSPARAA